MADDGSNRGRILWVDDEIDLLKPHILYLREREYEVTPVSSGEEALREIEKHSYQLVLLDEMMDGMDGLSTLEGIKKVNPALPVIMITKNEEEWLMNEAIAAEISGYLTKPVNPSQILMAAKSVLEKARIRSDKAASSYLEMFQELSARVEQAGELAEWIDIFQELTDWAVEFDKHKDLGLGQLLAEQHTTANQRFSQLVTEQYRQWLENPPETPFSHQFLDHFVLPHLEQGTQVVMLVVDCLRLDQWKAMRPILQERFSIDEAVQLALLPTATPYSRNAIFSGLLPDELPRKFPDEWAEMVASESSMNRHESTFLRSYLDRNGMKQIQMKYFKVITADEGQKVLGRLKEYRDTGMLAFVVNFVDMLAHHRAESDVIKEMLPDEAGYRATICSWLEQSWMGDLLGQLADWDNTVLVLTSDHGSILVDKPLRILGDRTTSSGVRYKYGKNLNAPEKGGLTIKKPADYHLPADDVTTNYIIARDRHFFVFPTDYHRYVKRFEGSFQHGGISMDEMIVPVATLRPREGG